MTTSTVAPQTFIERELANAPYKQVITRRDGSFPMLVFSNRPIAEATVDVFRSAIRACKPVPSVLGNHRRIPVPTP